MSMLRPAKAEGSFCFSAPGASQQGITHEYPVLRSPATQASVTVKKGTMGKKKRKKL